MSIQILNSSPGPISLVEIDGEYFYRVQYKKELKTNVKDMRMTNEEFRQLMLIDKLLFRRKYSITDFDDFQWSIDKRKAL